MVSIRPVLVAGAVRGLFAVRSAQPNPVHYLELLEMHSTYPPHSLVLTYPRLLLRDFNLLPCLIRNMG